MKKIEAIIRQEVFGLVRDGLAEIGISGLSISEIAGCGRQLGRTGLFRGNAYEIEFFTKVKIRNGRRRRKGRSHCGSSIT